MRDDVSHAKRIYLLSAKAKDCW